MKRKLIKRKAKYSNFQRLYKNTSIHHNMMYINQKHRPLTKFYISVLKIYTYIYNKHILTSYSFGNQITKCENKIVSKIIYFYNLQI